MATASQKQESPVEMVRVRNLRTNIITIDVDIDGDELRELAQEASKADPIHIRIKSRMVPGKEAKPYAELVIGSTLDVDKNDPGKPVSPKTPFPEPNFPVPLWKAARNQKHVFGMIKANQLSEYPDLGPRD